MKMVFTEITVTDTNVNMTRLNGITYAPPALLQMEMDISLKPRQTCVHLPKQMHWINNIQKNKTQKTREKPCQSLVKLVDKYHQYATGRTLKLYVKTTLKEMVYLK